MKKFRKKLNEEGAPANATSSSIAGIGVGPSGEPGISVASQRKHQRQNASSAPIMGNILRRPMLDTDLTENLINIIRKRKNKLSVNQAKIK